MREATALFCASVVDMVVWEKLLQVGWGMKAKARALKRLKKINPQAAKASAGGKQSPMT